jgi:DNA-binding winged helix-turn-helix (wHTH) protein
MGDEGRRFYDFGPYRIDTQKNELRCRGEKKDIGPQPLRLLLELVQKLGDPVKREDLWRVGWPDDKIRPQYQRLHVAINEIKNVLKEELPGPLIENERGVSYRFVPEVKIPPAYPLRYKPDETLSGKAAKLMIVENDFYDKDCNESGKGIPHRYHREIRQGELVVLDAATGLMWQRSGSSDDGHQCFTWDGAKQEYVAGLNAKQFAGYDDWRLPTLEEAMSLVTPKEAAGFSITLVDGGSNRETDHPVQIDRIFEKYPTYFWTADAVSPQRAWMVYLVDGECQTQQVDVNRYVKAVRTHTA